MTNQTTKSTGNTNLNLVVCELCKQTGKHGAQWLVYVDGQNTPVKVHRPCGETLLEKAPEGVTGRVVPTRELRAVWDRQRQERTAQAFWNEKFAQAKPISKPTLVVAPAAPTETAKAA